MSKTVIFNEDLRVPIKAWLPEGEPLEAAAHNQLLNMAKMPFVHKHVAIMPDVHWGMGATVGSVIPTQGAIIPAAVGVDIGCGMIAQRMSLRASDLPDNLFALRTELERVIPHGRTNDGGPGDRGAWKDVPTYITGGITDLHAGLKKITDRHPTLQRAASRIGIHAGTLGTGNHFVEVCLDTEGMVWVMLHSGSRGVGNAIGTYFINKAKEEMKRWFINIPDIDLAYLPEGSQLFDDYVFAVHWAQEYAARNRELMMFAALHALKNVIKIPFEFLSTAVNCHHNYVTKEHHYGANVWLTRKGAVRAREGDLGIIPGSMGARSYIVRGKGNKEAFDSCSHGAGRRMSRTEAKKKFTLADHMAATEKVECRKDENVIDETPAAYKDIDAVIAAQSDLIEVVHTLKQVVCVKG